MSGISRKAKSSAWIGQGSAASARQRRIAFLLTPGGLPLWEQRVWLLRRLTIISLRTFYGCETQDFHRRAYPFRALASKPPRTVFAAHTDRQETRNVPLYGQAALPVGSARMGCAWIPED
jgi:hypothetical protein